MPGFPFPFNQDRARPPRPATRLRGAAPPRDRARRRTRPALRSRPRRHPGSSTRSRTSLGTEDDAAGAPGRRRRPAALVRQSRSVYRSRRLGRSRGRRLGFERLAHLEDPAEPVRVRVSAVRAPRLAVHALQAKVPDRRVAHRDRPTLATEAARLEPSHDAGSSNDRAASPGDVGAAAALAVPRPFRPFRAGVHHVPRSWVNQETNRHSPGVSARVHVRLSRGADASLETSRAWDGDHAGFSAVHLRTRCSYAG